MKRLIFPLLFCLLFLTLNSYSQLKYNGLVTEIVDGRTIIVRSDSNVDRTIRLRAIEIPDENLSIGETVRDHLSQLLLGKRVSVTILPLDENLFVGEVVSAEIDISLQILRDGAAWFVEDDLMPISIEQRSSFRANELQAKDEKRGLWGVSGLITPSELRNLATQAADQNNDDIVAQAAWNTLGATVEGIFAGDTYVPSADGDCGGEIVRVVDGDTVNIQTPNGKRITVRLAGIDAPEKSQSCGLESKKHLSNMVLGRSVTCTSSKKDRYGRTIGKISLSGNDINKAMLANGYAWHYKQYQNDQNAEDRIGYAAAELSARNSRSGCLLRGAVPPWEYRRKLFFSQYYVPSYISNPSLLPSGINTQNQTRVNPQNGGLVQVKTYTRKDGTVVRGHTRSNPKP